MDRPARLPPRTAARVDVGTVGAGFLKRLTEPPRHAEAIDLTTISSTGCAADHEYESEVRSMKEIEPQIVVTEHGPYRVLGDVALYDAEGDLLRRSGSWCLCRCGGSRNKPFCDATHGLTGFDGSESADHGSIANRRDSYAAEGVTVYDDRTRGAHFGQCTRNLPAVFRADAEPFVNARGAPPADITAVVAGCPSGALAYAFGDDSEPVERPESPSITPIADGPYRVRGAIEVVGADGRPYERRERQTLCRCGHSRNKPFCDGSHWYAGFRDPLPPDLVKELPTLYEWAGGLAALERPRRCRRPSWARTRPAR